MSGSLFFLCILGYALLFMLFSPGLTAGGALLCSVCGMLFVSFYGCIMAGLMAPTAYVLLYGGLACLALGLVCALLDKRGLRRRLLSPGLLFFAVISVIAVLDARGSLIQDHDSLSYWARAVRELFTFERFYIHADATMFHQDYIPLMAALEYCIVRVFGWQDAYLYYVSAACIGASVAAVTDLLPKKRLAIPFSVLLYCAFCTFGFRLLNLRSDSPMTAVFAAGLITLLARRDDRASAFLPAVCACAVLVGFKIYSGLMFAAVIALALIAECISLRKKPALRTALVMTVVSIVLILCLQFGWSALYNVSKAQAAAGAAAAKAAYLGQEVQTGAAAVGVGALLSGNPRTAQLLQSLTPEKIQKVLDMARTTMAGYAASSLIWAWPFVLAALALSLLSRSSGRGRAVKMIIFALIAGVIYVLGLFGSYFVQAETSGAANTYLQTATTPLMVVSVFLTMWLAREKRSAPGFAVLCAMAVGMFIIAPPSYLLISSEPQQYESFAALANEFRTDVLDGQLAEEDHGKRALLIECSYGATQVKSPSGKTHAYAYFTLPLRMTEPLYYTYGDYTQLEEGIDGEALLNMIKSRRCELLILRIEDELYWDEIAYALDLYGDWDGPIGVYDIEYEPEDDSFTFSFRGGEEDWEEYEE